MQTIIIECKCHTGFHLSFSQLYTNLTCQMAQCPISGQCNTCSTLVRPLENTLTKSKRTERDELGGPGGRHEVRRPGDQTSHCS